MQRLISEIKGCDKCAISANTKNKSIGRGSFNPEYLFVGLNPGREENETGKPFCGPSGKLLDKWVEAMGIQPDQYAVVNLIKCFTPNESELQGDETSNCFPFLERQMALLRPRFVFLLGAKPTKAFLKTNIGITKLAGRMFLGKMEKEPYYIPLPHPSYYLRHGGKGWEETIEKAKLNISENVTSAYYPSDVKDFQEVEKIPFAKILEDEKETEEYHKANPQSYVPLHVHTTFSVTDSAVRIDHLVDYAAEMGFKSIAVTDHGSISGWIELQKESQRVGIKPLFGIEFYVADDYTNTNTDRYHVLVLAKNDVGVQNIFKLNDIAHREGFYYKPRILLEHLFQNHQGLVVTSACTLGVISKRIIDNNMEHGRSIAKRFKETFGEDFYLELQPHDFDDQRYVNSKIIDLAEELKVGLIVTTDSHYLAKEDKIVHDALKAIAFRKKMGEAGFSIDTNYIMDSKELFDCFTKEWGFDQSLIKNAMTNTERIADKCNVTIERYKNALPKVV